MTWVDYLATAREIAGQGVITSMSPPCLAEPRDMGIGSKNV